MKKILQVITISFLTILLFSCGNSTTKRNLPKVNGRDKVDLTYQEVIDKATELRSNGTNIITNYKYKLTGEVLNVVKINKEEITTKFKGTITNYLSSDNKIKTEIDLKSDFLKTKVELKGSSYIVPESNYVYYDLNSKINALDFNKDENYQLKEPLDEAVTIEIIDNIIVTKEKVLSLFNLPKFKDFVEKYEGLTFYVKENYFAVKFILSKYLVKEYSELFETVLEEVAAYKKISGEVVIIFEDNDLADFGAYINIEGNTSNVKNLININYSFEKDVKFPAFPDFSNYKQGSFDEIVRTY